MYWRFCLLIAPILIGSLVLVVAQSLSRPVLLVHKDGTPVRGGQVRWLDDRDRVGYAEDLGGGRWSVPGRAIALEVTGDSVADSLVSLNPHSDRVTVLQPATLEVTLHSDAAGAPPRHALHLLGNVHCLHQHPYCHRVDLRLGRLALESGELQDNAYMLQRGFGQRNHDPDNVSALMWRRGGHMEGWIPSSPKQLQGVPTASGTVRFDNVPRGSVVNLIVDPLQGWVVDDGAGARSSGRSFGLSSDIALDDGTVTSTVAVAPVAQIRAGSTATRDRRELVQLNWRNPNPESGSRHWRLLAELRPHYDSTPSGELPFLRLERGTYALQVIRSNPQGEVAFVVPESLELEAGETLRIPPPSLDPPRDHVPLELQILDSFGIDFIRGKSKARAPWGLEALRMGFKLEVDRLDGEGQWEYWASFGTKLAPNGQLNPLPLLPPGETLRVRLSQAWLDRMQHQQPIDLNPVDFEQVLHPAKGSPAIWSMRSTVAPSKP